jgi:hypothetical protein
MELKDYFASKKGVGVLATADASGKVNLAVFARPHVLDGGNVGFIMPDRLTHRNLASNPHAAYLFIEDEEHGERTWQGKRLHLTKTAEEQDTERVNALRRRTYGDERDGRFLVSFAVDEVLPLVGAGAR